MTYAWQDISPLDSYMIINPNPFSQKQEQVFQLLYQPIIGQSSTSLYRFFNEASREGEERELSYLFAMLKMGIKDFYQARIKLEGLALLDTYKDKDEGSYCFDLKKPLSARAFFSDLISTNLLIEEIGEQEFQRLKKFFEPTKVDSRRFKKINKSFLDVFHYSPRQGEDMQEGQGFSTSKLDSGVRLSEEESTFDWNLFLESMKSHFVSRKSLLEAQAKETILFLHECYGVDELDMQNMVLMSSDTETGTLSLKDLTKNVRSKYQLQKSENKPNENKKQASQKEASSFNLTQSEQALVEAARMNSPFAFATSIKEQRNGFVTQTEKWVIEELVRASKLKTEVINILIHFILVVMDNDAINQNYASKIANNWAKKEVDSAEEAIAYTRQFTKEKRNKQTSQPSKFARIIRQEKLPDWAVDSSDRKTSPDQPLSPDVQDSFAKRRLNFIKRSREKEGE